MWEAEIGRALRRTGIAVVVIAALYFVIGGVGGGLFLSWLLTPGNVDWSGANRPAPSDPLTIGFNSEYLIDFLKAQSGGEVRLEFKDAQSAGQMRPEDGGDDGFKYRYVVMPMRI